MTCEQNVIHDQHCTPSYATLPPPPSQPKESPQPYQYAIVKPNQQT